MHHESFNPDPWSGLSMHWVEHVVYFSAGPMVAPFVPLWLFRLLMLGLFIFPLDGHHGTFRVSVCAPSLVVCLVAPPYWYLLAAN